MIQSCFATVKLNRFPISDTSLRTVQSCAAGRASRLSPLCVALVEEGSNISPNFRKRYVSLLPAEFT